VIKFLGIQELSGMGYTAEIQELSGLRYIAEDVLYTPF
jgi:hypothetical protein